MTIWEKVVSLATPLLVLFGMWYVHEQKAGINDDRIQLILEDVKQIRAELLEIERRIPRVSSHVTE
jgi:hypothetical protein